jgi:hypothetical protein
MDLIAVDDPVARSQAAAAVDLPEQVLARGDVPPQPLELAGGQKPRNVTVGLDVAPLSVRSR